jgi:molybdenum cofactor biosynthesis enzyme MoaA
LREMRVEMQARDTRIQDDLKKLDTKMHEDFVRRDDFKDAVREIKDDMKAGFASVDATLRLIFKKLDSKE